MLQYVPCYSMQHVNMVHCSALTQFINAHCQEVKSGWQADLHSLTPTGDRAKEITRSISVFMEKDMGAFSLEKEGFRLFVKTLEAEYCIPSRTQLHGKARAGQGNQRWFRVFRRQRARLPAADGCTVTTSQLMWSPPPGKRFALFFPVGPACWRWGRGWRSGSWKLIMPSQTERGTWTLLRDWL